MVAIDSDWRYRYLNTAAEKLFGLTQSVLGRDARDVHRDGMSTPLPQAYDRVLRTRVPETVEHHYEPLETYVRATVRPWPDGIVISLVDVTAERQAQARLQRNLDLYTQLVDHTTQAIALRDLDGRFLLVNRAAAERLGRPAELIVGRLLEEVFPADLASALRAVDRLVQETGEVQESPVAHALHPERTVVAQVFAVRDVDGALVGIGTTVVDVTDLAATEAELAASQMRFRRVFGSTSLGLVVAPVEGRILEANGAICRLLGYSRAQLLGMSALDLMPPERRDAATRRRRTAVQNDDGYEVEDVLLRSDGSRVPVLMTVNVLDDPAGSGPILSAVVRDLTHLRELQQQVLAAERMEAVGQLAAGIAHDANNILAGIAGYAELLGPEVADRPAAARHLAGISRSVARAGDMVDGLMAISRGQPMQPAVLDLADVVRDLLDMLQRLLPPGIELSVVLQPASAVADVSQIRQVVLNLVVNARNALAGSGKVRISTGRLHAPGTRPLAVLTVTDDGPGMDADVARRCFEPFFTTRVGGGGTGLGLSTALRIARQSGGNLRVTTAVGAGASFQLVLPVAEQPASTRPRSNRAGVVAFPTVVVADDDPAVRNVIATTLEAAGYQVAVAGDAEQALAAAVEADLLLTDIEMPGMTGLELAVRLRHQQPHLPVLLVSGTSNADPRRPFLAKPFTPDALLAAVEAALADPR